MGTSSAYGGPASGTPLVPSWLEPDGVEVDGEDSVEVDTDTPSDLSTDATLTSAAVPTPSRFTASRNNFSRFARSGGQDRASLGRAVAGYVSTASGGAHTAARRLGSSREAGAQLLRFLGDVQTRGTREALRSLNLESLAGRPIEEIFLGLAEYVCPDGGTIDEGIARDAFFETIGDLAGLGLANLDALTVEQMQTVFELYATHAIEARLCNDVGMKVVTLPNDIRAAERVEMQLRDFIRRGVSDALTASRAAVPLLTPDRVLGFVNGVYESALNILQLLGEAEAAT